MKRDDFNNVLSLMAAIIFADKQVYDSEINAFTQSVSQLDFDNDFTRSPACQLNVTPDLSIEANPSEGDADNLNGQVSPSQLSEWYEKNQSHIRDSLSTPFYKDWFYNLLDQIADLPNKEKIITIMRDISKADGRVHVNERALITLAERHWGMR